MSKMIIRWCFPLFVVLLLSGCSEQGSALRIGLLVLVPFLLIIGGFWFLNLRGGEEDWDEQHFPDQDDDDDEDHFLM